MKQLALLSLTLNDVKPIKLQFVKYTDVDVLFDEIDIDDPVPNTQLLKVTVLLAIEPVILTDPVPKIQLFIGNCSMLQLSKFFAE